MTNRPEVSKPVFALPGWAPLVAIGFSLALAWVNFLTTARWAGEPGSLHGWRKPWYALALAAATLLVVVARREIGRPARIGPATSLAFLAAGAALLLACLFHRLPLSVWTEIPFKDDWTELFQHDGQRRRPAAAAASSSDGTGGSSAVTPRRPTSRRTSALLGVRADDDVRRSRWAITCCTPCCSWPRRCSSGGICGDEERETRILATALRVLLRAGYLWHARLERRHQLARRRVLRRSGAGRRPCRAARATVGRTGAAGRTDAGALHARGVLRLRGDLPRARGRSTSAIAPRSSASPLASAFAARRSAARALGVAAVSRVTSASTTPCTSPARQSTGRGSRGTCTTTSRSSLLPHRWFNDYRSLANVWLAPLIVVAVHPTAHAGRLLRRGRRPHAERSCG